MLTLQPTGGLANRLLALDSAVSLCNEIDIPLNVVWKRWDILNAEFSGIFELLDNFTVIEMKRQNYFFRQIEKGKLMLKYRKLILLPEFVEKRNANFDFTTLEKYNSVYLQAYNRFFPSKKPFSFLKPVEKISKKISRIVSVFPEKTFGIHIRRTDNINAVKNSPTSFFIRLMEKELKKNPSTAFFLATDDLKVVEELISLFPENIITNFDRFYGRNTLKGIEDAIVDLFCLSRASKIYGSFDSTFSQVASEISNIELEIVNNDK